MRVAHEDTSETSAMKMRVRASRLRVIAQFAHECTWNRGVACPKMHPMTQLAGELVSRRRGGRKNTWKDARGKREGHQARANINFSRLMEESSGRYNVSRQDYAPPGPE